MASPPPPPPHVAPLSDSTGVANSRETPAESPAASDRPKMETATSELSATPNSSSSSSATRKIPPVPIFLPEMAPTAPSHAEHPAAHIRGLDGQSSGATISAAKPYSASETTSPAPHSATGARILPPVPKFNAPENAKQSVSGRRPIVPPPVPKFYDESGEKKAMGPPPPRAPRVLPSPQVLREKPFEDVEQAHTAQENVPTETGNVILDSGSSALEASVGSTDVTAHVTEAISVEEKQAAVDSEGGPTAHVTEAISVEEKQSAVDREGGARECPPAAAAGVGLGQVPYVKPSWSAVPDQPFTLEIVKEGKILGTDDVSKKAAYMFGRSDRCDFILEHPTVSRYHAVLQYNSTGEAFLYDLGSTHGTFLNKIQVTGKDYVPLHVGDIVVFGHSTRLHVFQGPVELMPEEGILRRKRQSSNLLEAAQDRAIREESIIRGKRDALASTGITWGMQEDAEELEEEDEEEITWQTFKGELTDRQKKTLAKIHKHNEKLSNLKRENDAIQAKETSQGGLTQGQQTQVGRNEMRMEQLVEEVENLEETLNESIRESISGRTGRRKGQKKNPKEDEDDDDLSDDEFYDRASKIQLQKKKEATQILETADTLLDKKATLGKEMEALREAVRIEQSAYSSQEVQTGERKDPLDHFMTSLSTNIVKDKVSGLQKQLDSLIKDSERVERLLKIADPTGEGLMKWELRQGRTVGEQRVETAIQSVGNGMSSSSMDAQVLPTPLVTGSEMLGQQIFSQDNASDATERPSVAKEETVLSDDPVPLGPSDDSILPGLDPPVRLGAPKPKETEEAMIELSDDVKKEATKFVSYKDRKKVNSGLHLESGVFGVAQKDESPDASVANPEVSVSDTHVADSVALLLRHKSGLMAADSNDSQTVDHNDNDASTKKKKTSSRLSKKRKPNGPAGTSQNDIDNVDEWVPPAGQTGDGRTALNDKFGY